MIDLPLAGFDRLIDGRNETRIFDMKTIACVDLFCGAGGLTHGFVLEGMPVVAGIDMDPACRFPYEANNNAKFVERDISKVTAVELNSLFGNADLKILAGCAPCQPFSTYAQRYELDGKDGKWGLLYEFARLAEGTNPDVITMENVPSVAKHEVFHDFVDTLKRLGYNVWFDVVDSSQYGVPQTRKRMVLLASRHGAIKMIARQSQNQRRLDRQLDACVSCTLASLPPEINCTPRRCYRVRICNVSRSLSPEVHGVTGPSIWLQIVTVLRVVALIPVSMAVWNGTNPHQP